MKGNPVMKATRVTGPTPNAVLMMVVRTTTCSTPGCGSTDLVVTDATAGSVKRKCRSCWKAPRGKVAQVGRSWRPPWMDGE